MLLCLRGYPAPSSRFISPEMLLHDCHIYGNIKLRLMQQSLIPFTDRQSLERVVRIEKNLNSLGFFSPATKVKKTKKVISITRELEDGVKVEAKATIVGHETGLPTTADLDKYLGFQLIVADLKRKNGAIVNPVRFTTYHLLKLLGLKPAGKNYREVEDWLDRMSATWIKSEGAVYFAGTRRYAKDRFHVFDRAVTAGQGARGWHDSRTELCVA